MRAGRKDCVVGLDLRLLHVIRVGDDPQQPLGPRTWRRTWDNGFESAQDQHHIILIACRTGCRRVMHQARLLSTFLQRGDQIATEPGVTPLLTRRTFW